MLVSKHCFVCEATFSPLNDSFLHLRTFTLLESIFPLIMLHVIHMFMQTLLRRKYIIINHEVIISIIRDIWFANIPM